MANPKAAKQKQNIGNKILHLVIESLYELGMDKSVSALEQEIFCIALNSIKQGIDFFIIQ